MNRRKRAMSFRDALIQSDVKNKRRKAPEQKPPAPEKEPLPAKTEAKAEEPVKEEPKKAAPKKKGRKKKGEA